MDERQLHAQVLRKDTLYRTHPHLVPRSGDSTPPGWAAIVADALEQIIGLERAAGLQARIGQVKPKWGTLRFYVSGDPDATEPMRGAFERQLREIAQAAERRSETACEDCGAVSDLRRDGGRVFNACQAHARGCAVLPPEAGEAG